MTTQSLKAEEGGWVKPFKFLNPDLLEGREKFIRRRQRSRSLVFGSNLSVLSAELFDKETVMLIDGSTLLVRVMDEIGVLTISHTVKVMNILEIHLNRQTVGETVVSAKWSELQR